MIMCDQSFDSGTERFVSDNLASDLPEVNWLYISDYWRQLKTYHRGNQLQRSNTRSFL